MAAASPQPVAKGLEVESQPDSTRTADRIRASLASFRRSGDQEHLRLARQAARTLVTPIAAGGQLFEQEGDLWFEDAGSPTDNPPHGLLAHLRALVALRELSLQPGGEDVRKWFRQGVQTLERWLPRFDTGYWLRGELEPRETPLLLRIANPYGFRNHPLAVDRISLRDPETDTRITIDVGDASDTRGQDRIAGRDWGPPDRLGGRTVRRIRSVRPEGSPDPGSRERPPPHTYFYLTLPGDRGDNLRRTWLELEIEYFDERLANLSLQTRSIAPGSRFRNLRDGDLLLTGGRQWRRWIVPIRATDLGTWVNFSHQSQIAGHLRKLAATEPGLAPWAKLAAGYLRLAQRGSAPPRFVQPQQQELPRQTPLLPIYALDANGVVMQARATDRSRFLADGLFDPSSDRGTPVYSPFVTATQLLLGPDMSGGALSQADFDMRSVRRQPALDWFLDPKNMQGNENQVAYEFLFDNTYNDVVTPAPWGSAFSQAYVLKALDFARDHLDRKGEVGALIPRVVRAFGNPVEEGGLSTRDRAGRTFFEEVPNGTHVLNAHLISVPELWLAGRKYGDQHAINYGEAGIESLRELLWRFDTGYWLKYDQNPKKSLLFQIDWLAGFESPLIDEIYLENPQTGTATRVDVGAQDDAVGPTRISGLQWLSPARVDGRSVRSFGNGYAEQEEGTEGATRHNVYFTAALPEPVSGDYFDLPPHRLVIRYKDETPGRFAVRIRSINEGSRLTLVPLRDGVLATRGDGRWKEAVIQVHPRDMGWFKGADYQVFELEQLQRIGHLTKDRHFYQYLERHRFFLALQRLGLSAVAPTEPSGFVSMAAIDPETIGVSDASAVYPGHGFDNALDGDAFDDYVAGSEGVEQPFVVLDLGREAEIAGIRIRWFDDDNFARSVRISETGKWLRAGSEIMRVSPATGARTDVWFPRPRRLRALRLDFTDFSGQQRVLLRRLSVLAAREEPGIGDQEYGALPRDEVLPNERRTRKALEAALFSWGREGDLLSDADEQNPLRINRRPITNDVAALSDLLTRGAKSDHEMVVDLMSHLAQFRIGVASDTGPDVTLQERVGACGSLSGALLAMARAQGLAGRFVNLYNYPKQNGHTVVEIFADGKWRLYDPTYAAYYILNDGRSEEALSFHELVQSYEAGSPVEPVVGAYRRLISQFVGPEIYLNASPAGVIGPDRPMEFPLSLVYGEKDSLSQEEFGPENQGAEYIGAGQQNRMQRWTLGGLTPGKDYVFSLSPEWIGGKLESTGLASLLPGRIRNLFFAHEFDLTAELAGGVAAGSLEHRMLFYRGRAEPWDIRFRARTGEVTLRIGHPSRGPDFRYIHVARYELRRLQ